MPGQPQNKHASNAKPKMNALTKSAAFCKAPISGVCSDVCTQKHQAVSSHMLMIDDQYKKQTRISTLRERVLNRI
jgi:hypothetical protein